MYLYIKKWYRSKINTLFCVGTVIKYTILRYGLVIGSMTRNWKRDLRRHTTVSRTSLLRRHDEQADDDRTARYPVQLCFIGGHNSKSGGRLMEKILKRSCSGTKII